MNLSIAIPTYNRCSKVIHLLDFLESEILNIPEDKYEIEIIVSDNCSSDNTVEQIKKHKLYKASQLKLNVNKENIGLVDNLKKLASLCDLNSEYIWYMGDDDLFFSGIVLDVLESTRKHSSLIFINHYVTRLGDNRIIRATSVDLNKPNFYINGREACLDIWKVSGTSLMFISACVYNLKNLKNAFTKESQCDLASPLFFSFYCASLGSVTIVKKCLINNVWGQSSWSSNLKDVMFIYVPRVLNDITSCGYNRISVSFIKNRYVMIRRLKLYCSYIKHYIR